MNRLIWSVPPHSTLSATMLRLSHTHTGAPRMDIAGSSTALCRFRILQADLHSDSGWKRCNPIAASHRCCSPLLKPSVRRRLCLGDTCDQIHLHLRQFHPISNPVGPLDGMQSRGANYSAFVDSRYLVRVSPTNGRISTSAAVERRILVSL
jgi:hypothetical protein